MQFFLLLTLTYVTSIHKATATTTKNTLHHIKWITNQTLLPIRLKMVTPSLSSLLHDANENLNMLDTISWDWIKWSQNKFVTHLKEYSENFFIAENDLETSLFILGYDQAKHRLRELSTYEPVLVNHVSQGHVEILTGRRGGGGSGSKCENLTRNLFHLAHLSEHSIQSTSNDDHEDANKVSLMCVADFYVGKFYKKLKNEKLFLAQIMSQMEKSAQFKLDIDNENENFQINKPSLSYFEKVNEAKESGEAKSRQTSHFYKIRLSIGPLVVPKSTSKDTLIRCRLNLLNGDHDEYESTAYKVIEKINTTTKSIIIDEKSVVTSTNTIHSHIDYARNDVRGLVEEGGGVKHVYDYYFNYYYWSTIFYILFGCLFIVMAVFIFAMMLRIVYLKFTKKNTHSKLLNELNAADKV
jgi:hypothetical protein